MSSMIAPNMIFIQRQLHEKDVLAPGSVEQQEREDTLHMWAFRSGLRSVSHAGLSRVCAEPPCTDPVSYTHLTLPTKA